MEALCDSGTLRGTLLLDRRSSGPPQDLSHATAIVLPASKSPLPLHLHSKAVGKVERFASPLGYRSPDAQGDQLPRLLREYQQLPLPEGMCKINT
jgi:hypothetical protein